MAQQPQRLSAREPTRSSWALPDHAPAAPCIRLAAEPDLTAILHLIGTDPIASAREGHSEFVTDTVRAAFSAITDSPEHSLWVLEEGGEVLGTYQLSILPGLALGGAPRGLIDAVHVHPDSRSRGFGEDLLRHAIAQARRRGCGVLQLSADKRRTAEHRFYRRLGFVSCHEGMRLALVQD